MVKRRYSDVMVATGAVAEAIAALPAGEQTAWLALLWRHLEDQVGAEQVRRSRRMVDHLSGPINEPLQALEVGIS